MSLAGTDTRNHSPKGPRSPLLLAGYMLPILFLLIASNLLISSIRVRGMQLPDYAIWSGALQAEHKIRMLEEFARNGSVDVLVLSSSMGDHGISAATLARSSSKRHRRPLRAFNFSLGGADLPTYPVMYRLARLVAKPKEVWLVVPMVGPRREIVPGSLDETLLKGAVSRYEAFGLLRLSRRFYELPLIRFAPALRDAVLYGGFPHRPATSLDFYNINAFGDTISWVYNVEQYEVGARMAAERRREASRFVGHPNAAERQSIEAAYFHARTLAAIRELRDELRADGVRLTIIAFDHAVGLAMRDAEYLEASGRYFDYLAREFGAPVVDVRENFELMPYMIADPTHLNTIGARAFTETVADHLEGPAPRRAIRHEVSSRIQTLATDPEWTPFTALVPKSADEPSETLELRYLQNWGLGQLRAGSDVKLKIRLPDDSDVTVPVRAMPEGVVVADVSRLPIAGRDVALRLQLGLRSGAKGEALPTPLSSYRWSAESHPADFYKPRPQGHVESQARVYTVIEPIQVRWSGIPDPETDDWVGVYPVAGEKAARLTYAYLHGASSGRAEMRSLFIPGRYELRLVRGNGLDILGVSEPFDVIAITGTVRARRSQAAAGEPLHVQWSDVSHPHPKDWVGLFARDSEKTPLVFAETLGRASGEARLKVPNNARPGDYEVRLYSSGTWVVIARAVVSLTLASPRASPPGAQGSS